MRQLQQLRASYDAPKFSISLFLPEDIKSADSIEDFKRKLKKFLFMRAYESRRFYLLSVFYLLCTFIYFVVSG